MNRISEREKYRIQLEGCLNVRDLGGYPCVGGSTKSGSFYRADCLSKLREQDIEKLRELGIACVVDLRHDSEVQRNPNPLQGRDGFAYHHVSMLDGIQSANLEIPLPESMAQLYRGLVDESSEAIVQVLRIFIQNKNGGIVFHCTAGKDRTGVIAAILLLLAGVDESDIVSDYAMTYSLMKPIFEQVAAEAKKMGIDLPDYVFSSEPESMEELLAHMRERYGEITHYLLQSGLSSDEVVLLKEMMVQ